MRLGGDVARELGIVGAERGQALEQAMGNLARLVEVIPLLDRPEAATVTTRPYAALRPAGTTIGNNDLWFAAHAAANALIPVSNHSHKFVRVPGASGPELGPQPRAPNRRVFVRGSLNARSGCRDPSGRLARCCRACRASARMSTDLPRKGGTRGQSARLVSASALGKTETKPLRSEERPGPAPRACQRNAISSLDDDDSNRNRQAPFRQEQGSRARECRWASC